MAEAGPVRMAIGAALALAGLASALAAGAPFFAAAIAIIAGIAAAAFAFPAEGEAAAAASEEAKAEEPDEAAEAPLPDAASLLAAVDDPLLIVRGRRILLANAAARDLLGGHIEGVDVRLAIRHPAAAERLNDPPPGEEPERVTWTEIVGLGGPGRRWEMRATLLDDGSRLVRLTDRSAAHASEQMRVDFVANASHELRTPLATILGFLETLEDDAAAADPKLRRRFLTIMSEEASRMRHLVDDLMSLSRIEADRFTAPRDPVDLLSAVRDVEANVARLLEEKEARLEIENEAGETLVAGDRPQLVQLVQNLVVNALKYGRAGAPVRVCFHDAGAEMLRFSVVDEGEGIAPEHLPRLTERFYRIDPGRSRSVGGTGLGLAIVKHIVERHRGRLDIRSRLGEGTSVRVYLPRAQGPAPPGLSSKSHTGVTEKESG
ncbi:MAG: ATP-binding protein [Allosphingosinicella sp.]|uniref:ATP-binding protein n=1 Tax=Allosphingosinicella sp. TaxID=2823234 RepID=UPI003960F28C